MVMVCARFDAGTVRIEVAMVPRSMLDVNALAVTAYVLRRWSALRGERLDLRIGPLPVWMPDMYRRSIEPPIAIVVSIGRAIALSSLSLPTLGVSSLDLGRLWQRRRPFLFVCTPIGFSGPFGRVGKAA